MCATCLRFTQCVNMYGYGCVFPVGGVKIIRDCSLYFVRFDLYLNFLKQLFITSIPFML